MLYLADSLGVSFSSVDLAFVFCLKGALWCGIFSLCGIEVKPHYRNLVLQNKHKSGRSFLTKHTSSSLLNPSQLLDAVLLELGRMELWAVE